MDKPTDEIKRSTQDATGSSGRETRHRRPQTSGRRGRPPRNAEGDPKSPGRTESRAAGGTAVAEPEAVLNFRSETLGTPPKRRGRPPKDPAARMERDRLAAERAQAREEQERMRELEQRARSAEAGDEPGGAMDETGGKGAGERGKRGPRGSAVRGRKAGATDERGTAGKAGATGKRGVAEKRGAAEERGAAGTRGRGRPLGSRNIKNRTADADLTRAVRAEREKLGVGRGTADVGAARMTGEPATESDKGKGRGESMEHRQGLSKIDSERRPRRGSAADIVASGARAGGMRGRRPPKEPVSTGTRGGTAIAPMELPAHELSEKMVANTPQRTLERSTPGIGREERAERAAAPGMTIELRRRRKSPRMGKVLLEPTPIFNADEIRDIRLRLRMSQMSFADLLGVSVKAVEAWEAGRNRPGGPALRLMDLYVNHPELIPYG